MFNPLPDPLGRALRAARRAIELDRAQPAGMAVAGHWRIFICHDRAGLEEAFDRAIADQSAQRLRDGLGRATS